MKTSPATIVPSTQKGDVGVKRSKGERKNKRRLPR